MDVRSTFPPSGSATVRSTFRPKCSDIAWQKQLRDKYLEEDAPPVDLDLKKATVRKISRRLAQQVIYQYEWLGTMAGTDTHYGIFFPGLDDGLEYCAGVCCVGTNGAGSAGIDRHHEFGIQPGELATLARGACVHWAPVGTNSKLVSWTCKLLAKDVPHTKIILAYADPDAGEIGQIYQACNWYHVGKTKGNFQMISPEGRIMDRKCVGDYAKKMGVDYRTARLRMLEVGWTQQPVSRKCKYAQIIDKSDKALKAHIEAMSLPYPKRKADSLTQ